MYPSSSFINPECTWCTCAADRITHFKVPEIIFRSLSANKLSLPPDPNLGSQIAEIDPVYERQNRIRTIRYTLNLTLTRMGRIVEVEQVSSVYSKLTSQKNINFTTSKVKKTVNLTVDLLSLGIYAPGPQVSTYRPQILRGVRI